MMPMGMCAAGILEIPQQGLSLVLELAAGGSLRSILTDTKESQEDLPWDRRVRWLTEIAAGVEKLHSLFPRPLIHRYLSMILPIRIPILPPLCTLCSLLLCFSSVLSSGDLNCVRRCLLCAQGSEGGECSAEQH
jgi:serine/threonine protein kinase